jgi:hypothetical protein
MTFFVIPGLTRSSEAFLEVNKLLRALVSIDCAMAEVEIKRELKKKDFIWVELLKGILYFPQIKGSYPLFINKSGRITDPKVTPP